MHVMFDSVELDQIPTNAPAVAGYVGGQWATYSELRARFPHAYVVSIAVNASEDADVLDVETGDATVDQASDWVKRQLARGHVRPCVYADRWTMTSSLVPALAHSGIPRVKYRLWVADFTDVPHIPAGYGACQWTQTALGRNLDESLTKPGFFVASEAPQHTA